MVCRPPVHTLVGNLPVHTLVHLPVHPGGTSLVPGVYHLVVPPLVPGVYHLVYHLVYPGVLTVWYLVYPGVLTVWYLVYLVYLVYYLVYCQGVVLVYLVYCQGGVLVYLVYLVWYLVYPWCTWCGTWCGNFLRISAELSLILLRGRMNSYTLRAFRKNLTLCRFCRKYPELFGIRHGIKGRVPVTAGETG